MACYHPLTAYRTESGDVVFSELARNGGGTQFLLSCGQCIGCRLERSKQWAIRCVHESKLWPVNSFVTFTYSDEHVPEDMSLRYRDFQLFIKRLRRAGHSVRFFTSGEYGTVTKRPHYHALLFNYWPSDGIFYQKGEYGDLYSSPALTKLWGLGNCLYGEVTFESAAYVARYICDKVTGDAAPAHYAGRVPEFMHCSRAPAIGQAWFQRYFKDYQSGTCVIRGKEVLPPKRYRKLIKNTFPDEWSDIEARMELHMAKYAGERSESRLAVRERVAIRNAERFDKES